LMDEPFAALDEITRFKLNNDLLELWQDQRFTVVFVTHSVFESVFLSNRIVVMAARPGRVFEEVAVDAPYPRSDDFRTSPDYAALCRQTSDVLVRAINVTAESTSAPQSKNPPLSGPIRRRRAASAPSVSRRSENGRCPS